MHNSREHSVDKYRRAQRDFNFAAEHLHGQGIQQNACEQRHPQHQWKRQGHRAVKDQDRRDVNVGVVHPIQRRNEKLRDLGDDQQNEQYDKENHFRPVTTNTSSKWESSTAGASLACPSSARTLKLFTVPISKPDGKTPPTPDV